MGHGTVLAGRYRLEDRVETTPDGVLWHATDETLDRGVSVRVMHPHHLYAADAADAARRAALVEDSRMVRVLDVSVQDGHPFIVTERVGGVTLQDLATGRRLDAALARRVVGEVAQALERAGDRGLHHLRLSPRRVVIRPDGTVKLLGTAVDASAAGMDPYIPEIANRVDAVELVALLYFALTRRWPIDDAGGPGRVPTISTDVPPPASLVGGVPADLDRLCADTLGPHDDGPRDPAELVRLLAPWSPPAQLAAPSAPAAATPPAIAPGQHATASDATQLMDTVPAIADPRPAPLPQQGQQPARRPAGEPSPAVGGVGTRRRRDEAEVGPGTLLPVDQVATGTAPTAPTEPRAAAAPAARAAPPQPAGRVPPAPPGGPPPWADQPDPDSESAWWTRTMPEPEPPDTGSFPLLTPPSHRPPRDQTRLVILGVAGLVAVVLLVAVWSLRDFGDAGSGLLQGDPTFSTPPAATSSATPSADPTGSSSSSTTAQQQAAPVISGITAIDPQGDGEENGGDASNAIDGRKGTVWKTSFYSSRDFGGLKDGVGLVLDLGKPASTRQVRLSFAGDGGRVQLRAANRPAFKGSDVLASADLDNSPVTLRPSSPPRSRYLVLWFTRLTRVGGENRIDVSEISVR